ncbi:hypothetical protein ONK27_26860, partial [Salmonella enterica subsp. enterica serovar Virginia]|nr:hypothetical protein [Salmonella enterica subsp. enterica serovar Virginia]
KMVVEQEFAQIKHVLHGISLLGQCPDSINAALICRGEKMSIATFWFLKLCFVNRCKNIAINAKHERVIYKSLSGNSLKRYFVYNL